MLVFSTLIGIVLKLDIEDGIEFSASQISKDGHKEDKRCPNYPVEP